MTLGADPAPQKEPPSRTTPSTPAPKPAEPLRDPTQVPPPEPVPGDPNGPGPETCRLVDVLFSYRRL